MFAIALAGSFSAAGRVSGALDALLDAWPSVASDGRATASSSTAAAGILRWAVVARDRQVAPVWDAERQLLFVGDVRLYNRGALRRALGGSIRDGATDADLAFAAHVRWGDDCAKHLLGDFAFAVWDERRRSIFAVRDHLGVRPLYHLAIGGCAYLASDVRQLLALTPQPFKEIDERAVLERLLRVRRTGGITFFRNISALPPGHSVTIDASGCRSRRYWTPSFEEARNSFGEDIAEIQALFRRAVHDRLESEHPIVAHASGGVDSSAIIMAADEIYAREPARAPLVMASATTFGMPCDDSAYMDAVARRVRFEEIRWNALDPDLADLEQPSLSQPGLRHGIGGGPRRDLDLAQERDARVLLHGFFGDSLMYAFAVSRDMFRSAQWRALVGEAVATKSARAAGRFLIRSSFGLLPPATALRALDRIESRPRRPPHWLGPLLRERYPPPPENLALPAIDWPSHHVCELWARLTGASTRAAVDVTVAYGADAGIEIRLPYLDVRLAEKLINVSWQSRRPRRGDKRALYRDVLGPIVPPEFARRTDQGSWTPVWAARARRMLPVVQRILFDDVWLSAPYVDISAARTIFAGVNAQGAVADPAELLTVVRFAVLEAWLRRVYQYDNRLKERVCRTSE